MVRNLAKVAAAFKLPENEAGIAAIVKLSGIDRQVLETGQPVSTMSYTEGWYAAYNLRGKWIDLAYLAKNILRSARGDLQWWLGFYRGHTGRA